MGFLSRALCIQRSFGIPCAQVLDVIYHSASLFCFALSYRSKALYSDELIHLVKMFNLKVSSSIPEYLFDCFSALKVIILLFFHYFLSL